MVGVFMSSWLGTSVLNLGEWFIKRMPFVRHIYNASKQISTAISPGIVVVLLFLIISCFVESWLYDFSPIYCRSKHPGFQGSRHYKTSAYWWIRNWVHHIDRCSPGLSQETVTFFLGMKVLPKLKRLKIIADLCRWRGTLLCICADKSPLHWGCIPC